MKFINAFLVTSVFSLFLSSFASAASVNVNLDSEMEVKGYADTSKAEKVIDLKLYHLRNCYMDALKKKPGLKGKMTFKWGLDQEGAVTDPSLTESNVKNPEMVDCMIKSLSEWKFPKPEKENAGVTLKLTLSGTTKP